MSPGPIVSERPPRPIGEIASALGIPESLVEPHGRYKAKLDLAVLDGSGSRPRGKYILVSAITPTPLGEGKTTTAIGLAMALSRLGKRAVVTLRQSSLGPTFGLKGGGAGGGAAKLVPLEESILHVTGDAHAVAQAHNQLAALTDNVCFHGNPLGIDLQRIQRRRVLDVNDRCLRQITLGLGGKANGEPRDSGFDITAASELMAILALADGDSALAVLRDLRARLGRVVVAFDKTGSPVTAEQVRGAGAATVIMREALKPTLMQTSEGTPAIVHAGPFGNIAHGNSSIIADRIALRFADYVITEAGFGSDMGGEKFVDIKCRASGLKHDAAVLVCSVRALKMHSGKYNVAAGKPLPRELFVESAADVRAGGDNLKAHIGILRRFGAPVIVAINSFPEDTPAELEAIRELAMAAGAEGVAVSRAFAQGSAGALELGEAVVAAAAKTSEFRWLYPSELPLAHKIHALATQIYGAEEVSFSPRAKEQLAGFESAGFGTLPICMAKTHLSLSHDPKLKGAPRGYVFPIREVRLSAGAGFVYPLAGDMVTMPGLNATPAAQNIDIDSEGRTVGLF